MPRFECVQCLRPKGFCYCNQLQSIKSDWPIWILQHPNEVKHPIGTARIAHLSLIHSKLIKAERVSDNQVLKDEITNQKPLLVFPSKNSISISEFQNSQPQPLLFLDATWRKAKRMTYESPELDSLTHVHIEENIKSRYKIRKAPDLSNPALSTLEAIVYSLRKLENDSEKYQSLLDTMDWLIQQQIAQMGEELFYKNYVD